MGPQHPPPAFRSSPQPLPPLPRPQPLPLFYSSNTPRIHLSLQKSRVPPDGLGRDGLPQVRLESSVFPPRPTCSGQGEPSSRYRGMPSQALPPPVDPGRARLEKVFPFRSRVSRPQGFPPPLEGVWREIPPQFPEATEAPSCHPAPPPDLGRDQSIPAGAL